MSDTIFRFDNIWGSKILNLSSKIGHKILKSLETLIFLFQFAQNKSLKYIF